MAQILTCYYRYGRGGLCGRLLRAMRALADSGHTVHYLSVAPFPIDHPGCMFHRFPWPRKRADSVFFWACFYLFAPFMLAWLAVRWRITHLFGFSPTYAFLLKPAAGLRRIPVTCFVRGDAILAHRFRKRPDWLIRADTWIEASGIRRVRLVALQEHQVRAILERHPTVQPESVRMLPNDLPCGKTARPQAMHHPVRLAMVGALERVKNHRLALNIIARATEAYGVLHIVGEGPQEKTLRKLAASLGLSRRVIFHGWISAETIWPQIDLLLLPSLNEGMPGVLLEAIANHVPVLASDIPAHRALLPSDDLLPLDRPEKWLKALSRIVREPEQARQRQSLHIQPYRFDWDRRVVEIITA